MAKLKVLVAIFMTIFWFICLNIAQAAEPNLPSRTLPATSPLKCVHTDPVAEIAGCRVIIESKNSSPDDLFNAYRRTAGAYAQLRKFDQAIANENKALALHKNDISTLAYLGYLYDRKGAFAISISIFTKALSQFPASGMLYGLRAHSFYHDKNFESAVQDYTKAIDLSPNIYDFYVMRGNSYGKMRLWDKDISDATHALLINKTYSDAYITRGWGYSGEGQWQMSIADFVKATELDPNDDIAWNNRCYVEAVLGRLSDALADCNKAIELGNHYNMSFDSRAYVYLQSKRYDDAIADYTTALKWDPKSPDATYGRAVAKKYKGDSSSEEDFKVAKRLDPNIESEFLSHSAED